MMKKMFYLLLIIAITSCKDNSEKISGHWQVVLLEEDGEIQQYTSSTVDFGTDGTVIMERNGLLYRGKWIVNPSDSLFLIVENDTLKAKYRFVDDKLKIEGIEGGSTVYMELSSIKK